MSLDGARSGRRLRPRGLGRAVALLATASLAVGVTLTVATGGASAAARPHGDQVVDGDARFEVLTPTLIRMEYAGDRAFEDSPTFTVVNRDLPVPSYTTDVSGGYREIRTDDLVLRYRRNSGPFTSDNVSITLKNAGRTVVAHPTFPSQTLHTCGFATLCEAEDGSLAGGASPASDHTGYTGTGFVAGFEQTGASITDTITHVPAAGTYQLTLRYANAQGSDGQTTTRTLSTEINGAAGPSLSFAPTASWDTWSTVSVAVPLNAGSDTVEIAENAADSGKVNIDSFAATTTGAAYPAPTPPGDITTTAYGSGPSDTLGGWRRGLDAQSGAAPLAPGILDRTGWYLLDDTTTDLVGPRSAASGSGSLSIRPRPSHGGQPYEDGYFFGYGDDYQTALRDLHAITGPSDLLPESAYGVWYSRYYPYTTSDYENTLIPTFRAQHTPIDWLVVDTDWKAPSQWDGWNWNPALFPDPQSFVNWAHAQGLRIAMNIHPSISQSDPRYAQAQATAGGKLACSNGTCTFDWSDPNQLRAYFDLQQPFEAQGVDEWWLDWCCDASTVSMTGVTPDTWINAQYAADGDARGQRGFAFSRMGSSLTASGYSGSSGYPSGPWAEHRYTLQFTGDTFNTWQMLQFEAEFTQDEAAIGLPAVTDDIGSFHGDHDSDDMYVRWLQLGTFQPVFRLHSDHGDRLPWNYDDAARVPAEQFMNLREALVPYTYTLAKQAQDTGLPMLRALYLDYPDQAGAYANPDEYLYGPDVLVAPITTPDNTAGQGSVKVWFPAGSTWTDYFTGRTYQGGTSATITDSLSQIPVFLRDGGIMVARTNSVDDNAQQPLSQLTVNVAAGGDGSFDLYEDAGQGNDYLRGQSATTSIRWNDPGRTLSIGAQRGTYPGRVASRVYTLKLYDTTSPASVAVDGTPLPASAVSYNATTRTVSVVTPELSTSAGHTVTLRGPAGGGRG